MWICRSFPHSATFSFPNMGCGRTRRSRTRVSADDFENVDGISESGDLNSAHMR